MARVESDVRPLTARSVVASTLLGVQPPRLPSRNLVRAGELLGIAEGTVRVALSRMVANGELLLDDGWYELSGRLRARQERQEQSRRADTRPWSGAWTLAVVTRDRRSAHERGELREAMRALRLAELREGIWLRPDNLSPDRLPESLAVVDDQCRWFLAGLPDDDPVQLARELWDLPGWASRAQHLRSDMAEIVERLDADDVDALAPGFVLSAAVLRHLLSDPLLPAELLPQEWPGDHLRAEYDRYDRGFKRLWVEMFRQPTG